MSVLDEVLAYYATRVDVDGFWIRQLTSGVSPDQLVALRKFINRVDGLPFPKGIGGKDPAASGFGENFAAGQLHTTLFYGTYFCSQLLTDSYVDDVLFVEWDRPKVEHGIPCDQ